MLSNDNFNILNDANIVLNTAWKQLQKARAEGNRTPVILLAEMAYFQALQNLYVAAQNAVAPHERSPPSA